MELLHSRRKKNRRAETGARPAVTGDLGLFGLVEIVQTLALGRKTARVSLNGGDREGRIWFVSGEARHAVCGELRGESAFFEIMRWRSGHFSIVPAAEPDERTLDQDTLFLLMEGSRRIDESDHEAPASEPQERCHAGAPLSVTPQMRTELDDLFVDLASLSMSGRKNAVTVLTATSTTESENPSSGLPAEVIALQRELNVS